MTYFQCDYVEGCHPAILQKLCETNLEQTPGYGADHYCESARQKIRAACKREDLDVHFLVGGTQANTTVLAALLRPHQGALCAESGHIACHETGAIEATGHKVLAIPGCKEGKLTADQVRKLVEDHYNDETQEHMVQPKMVYISHPTELGTLYTKAELEAISSLCREKNLFLYVDGARLGYGITAPGTDVTMADLARLCHAFYIGGTKVGALFGEALVIAAPALKEDFRYFIKQKGGLLAKGRLLGVQFETMMEDGLYEEMGKRANEAAAIIRKAFADKGFSFFCDSPTNQQFPILPESVMKKLSEKYAFADFGKVDETHHAVRFCTSWATPLEHAQALAADVAAL